MTDERIRTAMDSWAMPEPLSWEAPSEACR
jgi:hypothetical protein